MHERWNRDRSKIEANHPPMFSAGLDSFIPPLPELSHESFQYFNDENGNMVIQTDENYTRVLKVGSEPQYRPFAVLRQFDTNMIRNFILMADDIKTDDLVIAKTAMPHRILKEAEIMQVSRHPNVAELLDIAVCGNQAYLIIEWLPGGDLANWIRNGNNLVSEVAAVFEQCAQAIDSVNKQGYIYADTKPPNIMFSRKDTVKLIDFENCSQIDAVDNSAPPSDFVTDKYAPPEQKNPFGDQRLYLQTDVFSLAAVLYEMLTGNQDYLSDVDREHFVQGDSELTVLEDYGKGISSSQQRALTRLLRRALSKDYRQRHPNVRVLNEEVQSILIT
ncbi:hypothetical protein A2165_03550 [Candidatus Curtissbacteria bacterium RBG_13_40_7]|uniref:Protein kinase domain-containing protein n=1 Tax=Candidatus Curtissbacteria bacterium RBG_13_40_7 TaxID=1797706 RepID=A0A1F5FXB2_9BACT|nr:MAG: hypothetical protein A2165_03550 [Candidatus Curtissbacteria bacterium RBG_13_40_7]